MTTYWLLVAWFNRPAVQRRRPLRPTRAGLVVFRGVTALAVIVVAWFALRYLWAPVVLAVGR